jgi:hypothetical protein
MSQPDDGLTVPVQNVAAAQSLEVVQHLIKDEAGRQAYTADPRGAFEERKQHPELPDHLRDADYGAIPTNSRSALEAFSEEQLALLSSLDQTFVEDGLYVQVPSAGKLFYK